MSKIRTKVTAKTTEELSQVLTAVTLLDGYVEGEIPRSEGVWTITCVVPKAATVAFKEFVKARHTT